MEDVEDNEDSEDEEVDEEGDEEGEERDDDIDEEGEEDEADVLNINPPDVIMPELKVNWKNLLDLVRRLVAFFKPYPLRRDILRGVYNEILKEKKEKAARVQMQKDRAKARMLELKKAKGKKRQIVSDDEEEEAEEKEAEPEKKEPEPAVEKEEEITLVLDVPTRWNSSIAMLASAIKMKEALKRVQQKGPLKDKFTLPTDKEWEAIDHLRSALMPVEILTKLLCEENVSILKSEALFQGAYRGLSSFNNAVATELKLKLEKRYNQRRQVNILSILTFILAPTEYSRKVTYYKLLNPDELRAEINQQYDRLFPELGEDSDIEIDAEVPDDPEPATIKPVASETERMMIFFQTAQDFVAAKVSSKPSLDTIGDEVTRAFETVEAIEKLRKPERALNSLLASSVECERAFSTIGQCHSKICNRLNDTSLDYMSFGKHFLRNEMKKKK